MLFNAPIHVTVLTHSMIPYPIKLLQITIRNEFSCCTRKLKSCHKWSDRSLFSYWIFCVAVIVCCGRRAHWYASIMYTVLKFLWQYQILIILLYWFRYCSVSICHINDQVILVGFVLIKPCNTTHQRDWWEIVPYCEYLSISSTFLKCLQASLLSLSNSQSDLRTTFDFWSIIDNNTTS